MSFDISSRASLSAGNHAHLKIQKSRPQPYATEVPVFYRVENERIALDIQGRIDGLYELADSVVIEEIKTTQKDFDEFITQNNDLHWAQVKVYAAIYAIENNLNKILTQLTYGHIETGEVRTYFQEYETDELRVFFIQLLTKYFEWAEKIQDWHQERDQSIFTSDFPFASFRNGQRQMINDVFAIIEQEEQIIIQAPTGIGKTVAVLFPAIKAMAAGHIQKIFYLTSRTTGRLIAEKTLAELKSSGLRIKFVTLTAKEKICFNPDKNCTPDECSFAKGYYDRVIEARKSLFVEDAFTADKIAEIAHANQICPFEFSLDMALWVGCIICDMNYVFDPRVYLRRFFLENPIDYTILVDEAHNLVDRSREMFSAKIEKMDFLKIRRLLKNKKSELYRAAGDVNRKMLEMKKALEEETSAWQEERPEKLLPPLKRFVISLEHWLSSHSGSPQTLEMLDHYFAASWFLKISELYDKNYATCLEKTYSNFSTKLYCIDPSEQLRETFERANSSVLFSATITPMSYFGQILGLKDSVEKRVFPSPFPQENLCILVSDSVSTLYRKRSQTKEALVQTIGSLVEAKKGNYMVYFPSYEYLRMALPLYETAFPHHKILVQTHEMREGERVNFLKNFSEENYHTLVGFVVMGGIFGEGIDLVGDRLSGAAIVGVGLPGISMEREIIRHHFDENQMPGFDYAYRLPGLIRVFQAAGRVIRTESDRGTVLLIDTRYSHPQYKELFPQEWQVLQTQNHSQIRHISGEFWAEPNT
ncbi:MAG: ATP-dependent DNA helicase [Candidatus Aminicenantes bacterium]|nr:MAG: ATP-dependent DNA helicase [Candidatus Aminicenantes bacterium]